MQESLTHTLPTAAAVKKDSVHPAGRHSAFSRQARLRTNRFRFQEQSRGDTLSATRMTHSLHSQAASFVTSECGFISRAASEQIADLRSQPARLARKQTHCSAMNSAQCVPLAP